MTGPSKSILATLRSELRAQVQTDYDYCFLRDFLERCVVDYFWYFGSSSPQISSLAHLPKLTRQLLKQHQERERGGRALFGRASANLWHRPSLGGINIGSYSIHVHLEALSGIPQQRN